MSKQNPIPKHKEDAEKQEPPKERVKEVGGFENKPEPTRYGDWDVNGRCSDF